MVGPRAPCRPGAPLAALAYALTFGLVGDHPLAHYAILTGLNLAVALLLFRLAGRFLDRATAAAVAATWLVLPTHSSLGRWASGVHVVLALALLLAGLLRLTQGAGVTTATTATTATAASTATAVTTATAATATATAAS